MADRIVLATVNAKYIHASLGLRYLFANMGELKPQTRLMEFTHDRPAAEIVEKILAEQPRIVGLGVYIWNVVHTAEIVALLKIAAPAVAVVLGGPEVSHELDAQALVQQADHTITGPGDLAFAALCRRILAGEQPPQVVHAEPVELAHLQWPYAEYTDHDLATRLIYVEASRGCPFRCAFCLSALDKTAIPFDLSQFLAQLRQLYERGLRHFKFVDRTFNLQLGHSTAILDFFLERLAPDLFLHFEMIPDRLPPQLRERLARFLPGTLQLEIGIQTLNPRSQQQIDRVQDAERAQANLLWLRQHSHAHLHVDLIAGLPGEDMASFGNGFNWLVGLGVHEVQVGILKRLRGTPLAERASDLGLRFAPTPPYLVVQTPDWSFADLQRLGRLARYWDLLGNSARFPHLLPLLLGEQPFQRMLAFSDWFFASTGQTHQLNADRLGQSVGAWLTQMGSLDSGIVAEAWRNDQTHQARAAAKTRRARQERSVAAENAVAGKEGTR